jgi:hypothetical protein
MKIIGLFSIQRTGTNYLHSVLRQWPSLASFGELFHPVHVFNLKPSVLRALSKRAGIEFRASQKNDVGVEFTRWARANPLDVLDTLEQVVSRKERAGLMFKVFRNQWTSAPAEVIATLVRRPEFVPVVLQRRCIDCYISLCKAEAAGRYKGVETTQAPVTLDPSDYERWAQESRAWYRFVDGALVGGGKVPLRVFYEQDIEMPPKALSDHWAGLLELAPAIEIDSAQTVQRQDRASTLQAKIANYDEFVSALARRGLMQEALGYFLDTPS